MKKTAEILSKIAYFIAAAFLGYLAYNTTHYTFTHDFDDYSAAYLYEAPDSRFMNLFMLVVIIAVVLLISKLVFLGCKTDVSKNKRVLIFSGAASVVMFFLLCMWVHHTHIAPFWDQAVTVQAASDFIKGDYSYMFNDFYLTMYPQQLGIIFFESIILRIWDNYQVFQYLNAFFIAGLIFLSGRLSHALFDKAEADFFTVLFTALCAPLFYYVSYVYGDVFSITASFFVGWAIIKWLKGGKILYPILAILTSMIMLPVRQNTIIFLITLAIVLVINAIKNKKGLPLLLAALLLILPSLVNTGIRTFYEKKLAAEIQNTNTSSVVTEYYEEKGDFKFDNEIPKINWIVMGMRGDLEDGKGVGYYDGYNYYMWTVLGNSKEAATEYSKEQLALYLQSYREDPVHCYKFFRYKLMEQWLEPTFDCIYMTVSDNGNSWDEVELLYNLDAVLGLNKYMNYYLTAAYFLAFLYAVYTFWHDKEHYDLLVAVFFIGVFLFSIIWEAKGRYTFPGFVTMLLFTGAGLYKLKEVCVLLFKKIVKKGKA